MTLIERQDVATAESVRQYDDGCVGQPNPKIRIPLDDPEGLRDVRRTDRLKFVDAARDIAQEFGRFALAGVRGDQIVELGKHERREDPPSWLQQDARGRDVMLLPGVQSGEKTARVDQDQRLPNPVRCSSARSANVGSSLTKIGIVGAGGARRASAI